MSEMTVEEQIARLAHRGQVDKAGHPYIEHVERVVARVKGDELAEAAAWLHDVIEDAPTFEWIIRDRAKRVFGAVLMLSRNKNLPYADYIEELATNGTAVARKVKLADLHDHLENPGCPDSLRPRYEAALKRLSEGA